MRCSLTTTLLAVLFVEAGAWQLATPLTSRSSVPATRRVLSPVCQEGPSDGSAYPTPPAIKRTKYEEVKGEGAVCDFPGCDQNGRAMGGLGAIPLFSWWPIKVRMMLLRIRCQPIALSADPRPQFCACALRRTGHAPSAPMRASNTRAQARALMRSCSRRTRRVDTTAMTKACAQARAQPQVLRSP